MSDAVLTSDSPAPRGRPRDLGKLEALLAAGRALFIEQGYDPVTVDRIIRRAQVSRATFYAHFPDKMALLEAIVGRESRRIVADGWLEASSEGELEDTLAAFGANLLRFMADPDMLAMERLAASASSQNPGLGVRLYEAGPGRGVALMKRLLAQAVARAQLAPCDLDQAVVDLMGLWQGMLRTELTFNRRERPSASEVAARARHGARQFLRLYAADA